MLQVARITAVESIPQELRKLEAANNGNSAAYQHILSLAYGRKGKLRWELMEVNIFTSLTIANEFNNF